MHWVVSDVFYNSSHDQKKHILFQKGQIIGPLREKEKLSEVLKLLWLG